MKKYIIFLLFIAFSFLSFGGEITLDGIFQGKNLSKVKNLCEQFKIIANFYEIKKLF